MSSDGISFGRFRYDPAAELLYRGGDAVPLGRRAQRLLAMLLQHRGDVVGKQDLIDAAWPLESVEESNLSVQISKLRQLIGSQWIRTVERVGYRFAILPASGVSITEHIGLPGLAILPFADLSRQGDHRRVADGLVEDLTTALARFKSLTVAARNASFQHDGRSSDVRRVASELGVRYVLEGSIRIDHGRPRVSAQLIDGATGAHVWAETVDGSTGDAVVDLLAATVEARIHAAEIARSRRERPESREAYDFYLRARLKIVSSEPGDNAVAAVFYAKALELEPDNALYVSGAAEALQHRWAVGWPPLTGDDPGLIRELGRRALDHPDIDAVSLGLIGNAMFSGGDPDLGAALTDRAARMNPNSPLALVCDGDSHLWVGSLDRAEEIFTRSIGLDPLDPTQRFAHGGLAAVHLFRGEFEKAIAAARRTYAISRAYIGGHWNIIAANIYLGRMDDARRYLDRYRGIVPGVTLDSIRRGQPFADPSRLTTLIEGLRLAGLPEH